MTMLYIRGRLAIQSFLDRAKNVISNPRGATVSEYALVLALVTVAVIGALTTLGGAINEKIADIVAQIRATSAP